MGATVTCGKHAAAFESNGRVIYVLFGKTYEENCHPHTPRWHPVSYGSYETVMKWVFLAASSCEGGMLKNTRGYGHIQPENYLADWMRKLKAPTLMHNITVDIYVGQPGYWRAPIEADSGDSHTLENQKTQVLSRLRAEGFFDVADKLEAGQHVTENLYDCIDLLDVVYPGGRYIWRVIGDMPSINNPGHQELAPEIRTGQSTQVDWNVWKVNGDGYLLIKQDGTSKVEMPYSIVGGYINEVAYPMEMQRTGSAISAITRFRDMVKSASSLPGKAKVTIRRNPERERWDIETVDELAKALGVAHADGHAPSVFTTPLDALREADRKDQTTLWRLKSIKDATWDIPIAETSVDTMQFQQLDLLAA